MTPQHQWVLSSGHVRSTDKERDRSTPPTNTHFLPYGIRYTPERSSSQRICGLGFQAQQPARPERGPVDEVSAYLQQQLKERQWDYDLVSLAADARVTDDGNLVGLQVPRTCEAASWEPNDVYDELRHAGFSGCSEEDQEETFNRFLKPAAPPDSGNGVVVPHEAPDGPPKPKKKGKK